MQNEEQRQHADRLKSRHSITPPSKLQQRVARDHAGHHGTQEAPPHSAATRQRSRSPEKPVWSTVSSRHLSPPVPGRAPYEQSGHSQASSGSRDNGAMVGPLCIYYTAFCNDEYLFVSFFLQLLGAATPSSHGSPADSNKSWGGERDVGSSLLGNNDPVRRTAKKRIPGMEPKGKRRQHEKVMSLSTY